MEDELKKAKKRQAMLDNIGVVVATLIMVIMALTIVSIKVVMFRKETGNATWTPLPQRWNSTARVTGHGFIPCEGIVPAPSWCDFPPYKARLQRMY